MDRPDAPSSKIIKTAVRPAIVSIQLFQRFKRLLPALLRSEVQRGMAAVVRQRKHFGEKPGVLARDGGRCEQSVELVEPQISRCPRAQGLRPAPCGR